MLNRLVKMLLLTSVTGILLSCSSYKQNIMFKTPEGFQSAEMAMGENQDYLIQKNDLLYVDVFSNNGERLIDPNPQLSNTNSAARDREQDKIKFLVSFDGKARFPMIGEIYLEGQTLRQAELIIQEEYAKFFKDPYVVTSFANKRAILLGATGGQVIPMNNQSMRLSEVLALGEGLDNNAKAQNIRILRGKDVFVVDLSTLAGYQSGNILIQPGDIIYVEPVRKPVSEATRDYGTLLSVVVSLASLVVIILSVR